MENFETMLVEAGVKAANAKIIATLNQKGVDLGNAVKLADKILGTLKVYSQTNVWLENGRYEDTPHSMIKSSYSADHKFIATFKSEEVYTEEERKQNLQELSRCSEWFAS